MNKALHVFALCTVLLAGGCTAAANMVDSATKNLFLEEEANFTQQSNAAADYLVSQARTHIGRGDLIIVEPFNDVDQPGMSSELSKTLPEQIGIRFSYLGYQMDLSGVATSADTNYLKPPASVGSPDFVLSGTYKRHRSDMDVSVRMTDINTKQVIAAFDYTMPWSRQVSELSSPKPKIVRMTDQ